MKTNQFRAMMLVLLMAVVSLGMVNAQAITGNEYEWPVHDTG